MPTMILQGWEMHYITEGEGFPLLLLPEPDGTIELWTPQIPLLAEMCRTIAYCLRPLTSGSADSQDISSPPAVLTLSAWLDALHLERVYLASPRHSWLAALQFACSASKRLEGLLLIDMASTAASPLASAEHHTTPLSSLPLAQLHLPVLVLSGAATAPPDPDVETLARTLPQCTRVGLPQEVLPPHTPHSLQLGHTMIRFLIHCERQRNLVRGASLLF